MITADAERAFVGALLNLPVDRARQALALVDVADLGDLRLQVVHRLIEELVEDNVVPDPPAVFARARTQATVTGADAVRSLGALLVDLFAGCPTATSAPVYAAAVLEDAVRRRCIDLAVRIGQAADGESLASLVTLVDREVQDVRALVARRQAMDTPAPRLRSVVA